ncbi:MAG TPA: hypothetical protein VH518_04905, partial [Tepidisphaeraceae bacterium]
MTQSEAAPPPQALDSSDEPTITPPLTIGRSRQALASTPGLSQGRIHRLYDKVEAFVSKLSMRDNFWNG